MISRPRNRIGFGWLFCKIICVKLLVEPIVESTAKWSAAEAKSVLARLLVMLDGIACRDTVPGSKHAAAIAQIMQSLTGDIHRHAAPMGDRDDQRGEPVGGGGRIWHGGEWLQKLRRKGDKGVVGTRRPLSLENLAQPARSPQDPGLTSLSKIKMPVKPKSECEGK